MYSKMMIPVDLGHTEHLNKALGLVAELLTTFGGEAHLVGVTMSAPTDVARNTDDYDKKLTAFAAERSGSLGVKFEPHTEISHDVRVDLDEVLQRTAENLGIDLIVMASHIPGFAERIFASNAGYLASHAKISVLVVR